VLLSALLVFAAIVKLLAGHQKDFVLPPSLFYGTIVAELLLAIALWSRYRTAALLICIVMFAIGSGIGLLSGKPCGCLPLQGVWGSNAFHLVLAGGCGAIATILLWINQSQKEFAQAQSRAA